MQNKRTLIALLVVLALIVVVAVPAIGSAAGFGPMGGIGQMHPSDEDSSTPAATATVSPTLRITPRTINLRAKGSFKAHIDLGADTSASVVATSVEITAIGDTATTLTPIAVSNVATGEVVAKFRRSALKGLVSAGKTTFTVSFVLGDGTAVSLTDTVRVINPGHKGKGHGKGHAKSHGKKHGSSAGHGHGTGGGMQG